MEKLVIRRKLVAQAYTRLEHIAARFQLMHEKPDMFDDDEKMMCRDSLIKRFEFSYDISWKFYKDLLEVHYGILTPSSKKVFQECIIQQICTQEEGEQFLAMVDARNATSHQYSEELADQIGLKIINFYSIMKKVFDRIN
jgi:nucleotidyltransferase substrate binding protein (TIGR01987 family)